MSKKVYIVCDTDGCNNSVDPDTLGTKTEQRTFEGWYVDESIAICPECPTAKILASKLFQIYQEVKDE